MGKVPLVVASYIYWFVDKKVSKVVLRGWVSALLLALHTHAWKNIGHIVSVP
jgi:hypothetical protein